jgi:hypothetical protein
MSTQLQLDFGPEFDPKPLNELNPGHSIELMDRLYVMMNTVNDHALQHPFTENYQEVGKLIQEALEKMWAAYQLVGNIEYTSINK